MGKIKEIDIKVQNMRTEDLIAYIIRGAYVIGKAGESIVGDYECVNEIISRLKRFDVMIHDLDVAINSLDTGV